MPSDPEDKSNPDDPLKVEIGAVAKAEAAAKYERKTQVSITVPEGHCHVNRKFAGQ